MKNLLVISIVASITTLLVGAYALIAAGSLEGVNTTIGKPEVIGAYFFFGVVMMVCSITSLIAIIRAIKKT